MARLFIAPLKPPKKSRKNNIKGKVMTMYFESKKDVKKEQFYKAMNNATAVAVVGLVQGIEQVKDLGYDKHSKSIVNKYKERAEQAIVALAGVSRAGEDERKQAIATAYKLWESTLENASENASENA